MTDAVLITLSVPFDLDPWLATRTNETYFSSAFRSSSLFISRDAIWKRHLLTIMQLVANLVNRKWCKKTWKMTETLAYRYSSESAPRELSNEYQHDRVQMFFENLCVFLHWMKVTSALDGLILLACPLLSCPGKKKTRSQWMDFYPANSRPSSRYWFANLLITEWNLSISLMKCLSFFFAIWKWLLAIILTISMLRLLSSKALEH